MRVTVPSYPSAEEAEAHLPLRVVPVRIHETHRLPRPQRQPPVDDRKRGVGRDEGREDVVAAVAGAAVLVAPAVVGGKEVGEGGEEVVVAACAGFDDGDAAVACGTKTFRRPSAPCATSRRKAAQSPVMSATASWVPVVRSRVRVLNALLMSPFSYGWGVDAGSRVFAAGAMSA